MVNYKDGKVYKIIDNTTNNIYIGSTAQDRLCRRLQKHVSDYKQYLKGNRKCYASSFDILKNGDYYIELIEKVPCDSRDELTKREGHYVRTLECVNKNVPGRTMKEWQKKYHEEHKEEIKEWRKKHYEENKEEYNKKGKEYRSKKKNKARRKKYCEEHKEEHKEYRKKHYAYQSSWGGPMYSYHNNLLRIDIDLFH